MQRACLCGTCATAKHHLISCPKRSTWTQKKGGREGQPKEPHVLRGDSGKDPPPVKQKPRSQGIEVRDRWEGDPRESPGKGSWFVVVGCCFLLFVAVLLFVIVVCCCLGLCLSLWLLLLVVGCCCCWCCCCCSCCCSCCCCCCCCCCSCCCCCCCCCCCYFCCCSSCSMLLLLPLRQTCLLAAASPFLPSSSLTRSPLRRPGSADLFELASSFLLFFAQDQRTYASMAVDKVQPAWLWVPWSSVRVRCFHTRRSYFYNILTMLTVPPQKVRCRWSMWRDFWWA